MDRQITYFGQQPLETDGLNSNRFAMIGLAKLASAILGTGPVLHSLPCTPGTGLTVSVGAGQVYQMAAIDSTAYSSLPADTAHQILKQGVLLDPVTLNCPAPATSGQSINYLIQVGFQENDTGAQVLKYHNASNPAVAFTGPGGAGASNFTVRSGQCVVQVKAGTAAATGSQVTPSPDSGFIAAYVVTVANGASSIVTGNIAVAANAPFLTGLLASHHSGAPGQAPKIDLTKEVTGVLPMVNLPVGLPAWCGTSTGAANAQVLTPSASLSAVPSGTALAFKAGFTNTGAMTVTVAGGFGPYNVKKDGPTGPVALAGGEVVLGNVVTGRIEGTDFHLGATELGTAALAQASSNTGTVAAVSGATAANHLALFSDTLGTIIDGGPVGAAAPSVFVNASGNVTSGAYDVDTSGGAITLTLPAAPTAGMVIVFSDATGNFSINPLTINPNGKTIFGDTNNMVVNVNGLVLKFIYIGSDWRAI